MRAHRLVPLLLVASLGLVAACSSGKEESTSSEGGALSTAFEASAASRHVPRDLLVAISVVEDGLAIPKTRDVDVANEVPAAGPLQLRRGRLDTLARASQILGRDELDLRRDADLALEGGAAVLAELGQKMGAHDGSLASYEAAIEEMGGFADDAHRHAYAHQVFALLARGGTFEGRDGERVHLDAHPEIPPTLTFDLSSTLSVEAQAQFPGAQYFPTSCANTKCQTDRSGNTVSSIVIHDTEGGFSASVATLQNDPGKSVHYIVNTDGTVGQFVPESYTAYHAGNFYYNQRSVGIEHVGYANKPYTEKQYAASAALVNYLRTKYNVPADRSHIIGHEAIPDGNRIAESSGPCVASPASCEANANYGGADNHHDPGDWEWATYMPRIGGSAKTNDVTPVLNCSFDGTHAFKSDAQGKVIVMPCSKCEVKPSGQDDVCTPPVGGDDGGAPPPPPPAGDAGAVSPGTPPQPGVGASPTPTAPPPTDPGIGGDSSGGCSAAPHGAGSPWTFVVGLGAALALSASRRRSRRR